MAKRRVRQPPLSATRKRWAEQRRGAQEFKGKRLAHNIAIRISYERKLTKMIDQMTNEVNREVRALFKTPEAKEYFAQDGSLSSQARILLSKLNKKFAKSFDTDGKKVTEGIINRIERYSANTLKSSIEQLSGGLSIKTDFITGEIQETIKASTTRNVNLIKSIQSKYFEEIEDLVMRSILPGGRGLEDLKVLDKIKDKTINRGVNIAKDQTRKAYNNLNVARMEKVGVQEFEWVHSGGGKDPRDYHQNNLNGKVFSLNDLPVIDPKTGTRGIPGQLVNCHPGDTLIDNPYGINKLYRRIYSGELLSFVSNDGVILESTPNHPILTDSGWKPAKLINDGDYLLSTLDKGVNAGKSNIENGESKFVDVFDAFSFFVGSDRANITTSGLEFHGDASNKEVEIIDIDGVLPFELDADACKEICELILSWSLDNGIINEFRGSSSAELVMRHLGSPESLVCSFGSILSFLKSKGFRADDRRLALASYLNSFFNESSPDDISGNIEIFSDLHFAKSANVASNDFICREFLSACARYFSLWNDESFVSELLGEIVCTASDNIGDVFNGSNPVKQGFCVVKKFSRKFFGHVYNLESVGNWYTGNGIITHNCKCTMRPVVKFGGE